MFLIDSRYKRRVIDPILSRSSIEKNLMHVQIHVDSLIFGSTNQVMVDGITKLMISKFQMSMNREINFFLGLEIKKVP